MTTHTGALAMPEKVLHGVLESLGVVSGETPGEAFDIAEMLARAAVQPVTAPPSSLIPGASPSISPISPSRVVWICPSPGLVSRPRSTRFSTWGRPTTHSTWGALSEAGPLRRSRRPLRSIGRVRRGAGSVHRSSAFALG